MHTQSSKRVCIIYQFVYIYSDKTLRRSCVLCGYGDTERAGSSSRRPSRPKYTHIQIYVYTLCTINCVYSVRTECYGMGAAQRNAHDKLAQVAFSLPCLSCDVVVCDASPFAFLSPDRNVDDNNDDGRHANIACNDDATWRSLFMLAAWRLCGILQQETQHL